MGITIIGNLNVNVDNTDSTAVYLNMLTENNKTVVFRKNDIDMISFSGVTDFEAYSETEISLHHTAEYGNIEIHFDMKKVQDIIFDPNLIIIRFK